MTPTARASDRPIDRPIHNLSKKRTEEKWITETFKRNKLKFHHSKFKLANDYVDVTTSKRHLRTRRHHALQLTDIGENRTAKTPTFAFIIMEFIKWNMIIESLTKENVCVKYFSSWLEETAMIKRKMCWNTTTATMTTRTTTALQWSDARYAETR